MLDALWEAQDRLLPLLESFPGDVWSDENPDPCGTGPFTEVRSKDPHPQSTSLHISPISECFVVTTTPHPQYAPAPRSEDFHMLGSDYSIHPIHFDVSLTEDHGYRYQLLQNPDRSHHFPLLHLFTHLIQRIVVPSKMSLIYLCILLLSKCPGKLRPKLKNQEGLHYAKPTSDFCDARTGDPRQAEAPEPTSKRWMSAPLPTRLPGCLFLTPGNPACSAEQVRRLHRFSSDFDRGLSIFCARLIYRLNVFSRFHARLPQRR